MSRGSSFHSALKLHLLTAFPLFWVLMYTNDFLYHIGILMRQKPWGTAVSTIVYIRQAFVLVCLEQSIFKPNV